MFDMNMKGIRFDTGRVNGAAQLPEVLARCAALGLTPEAVNATVVPWRQMPEALMAGAFRPIAVR